jgi:predicted PurR-regulated permease PerM
MEITSFILGVCAVIVIAMVVGTFVNYVGVKSLKEQLDTLDRDIHAEVQILIQNLDKETERLTDYVDSLHNISENNMNEIYRYIDSRFDKTENKFSNQIASGVEVKKALDEIKDLNDRLDKFIRNYQNI